MNGHMFDVEQAERSSSEEEQTKGNAFNRFFKLGQNTGAQAVTGAKGWTMKGAEKIEDLAFWYDKKVERMNAWAESSKVRRHKVFLIVWWNITKSYWLGWIYIV